MAKQAIPDEVRAQVLEIVEAFNKSEPQVKKCPYVARFQGSYLYLDHQERGGQSPVCRLKYTGKLDDWDFAIYKYSKEHYNPDEWLFPGGEHVDGTIEGAMRAGLEAYPPAPAVGRIQSILGCLFLPVWLILGALHSMLSRLKKESA